LNRIPNIKAIAVTINVLQDDLYAGVILHFPGQTYRCTGEQHLRGELRLTGDPWILDRLFGDHYLGRIGSRFLVDSEVHFLDGRCRY
jgi:hypothetical protein